MRRFITLVVVLVLLLVAVDRVAAWFAGRAIAQQIESTQPVSSRPDVAVKGFPFLTQALRGRYQEIDAVLTDPEVQGGLTIDTLDVRLRGVQVGVGDLINRRVSSIPVDAATAVANVSFTSLNAAARQNLPDTESTVTFAQGEGNQLAVSGSYRSSALNAKLDVTARLVADDGDLVVQLAPDALDGLPAALRPQVQALIAKAGRLPSLPFGFQARSVTVNATGIQVEAVSNALNLESS